MATYRAVYQRRTPPFLLLKRCTLAISVQQCLCHLLATTRTIEALARRRASPTNNSHRKSAHFPVWKPPTLKMKVQNEGVTLSPSGDKQNYTLTILLDPIRCAKPVPGFFVSIAIPQLYAWFSLKCHSGPV